MSDVKDGSHTMGELDAKHVADSNAAAEQATSKWGYYPAKSTKVNPTNAAIPNVFGPDTKTVNGGAGPAHQPQNASK